MFTVCAPIAAVIACCGTAIARASSAASLPALPTSIGGASGGDTTRPPRSSSLTPPESPQAGARARRTRQRLRISRVLAFSTAPVNRGSVSSMDPQEALAQGYAALAVAFVLGTLWGSFANVCIYRWPPTEEHPKGLSVVKPG